MKDEEIAYNGYIRGNLFNDLYEPYKNYIPEQINPKNDKEHMQLLVQMYGFAAHELTLYLDNNPNDKEIINLRYKYQKLYDEVLKNYETKYGPINLNSDNLNKNPWAWNLNNFPWEDNNV